MGSSYRLLTFLFHIYFYFVFCILLWCLTLGPRACLLSIEAREGIRQILLMGVIEGCELPYRYGNQTWALAGPASALGY